MTMLPVLLLLSSSGTEASVLPLLLTSSPPPLSSTSSTLTCSAASTGARPDIVWLRDGLRLSGEERLEAEGSGEMTEVVSSLLPGCSSVPHLYTCLAVGGGHQVASQSLVLPEEECRHQETVTTWYSNLLARLGSTVELRCEDVVEGVNIPGQWEGHGDTAGRLVITDLLWADMGVYTCTTRRGQRETFLYPYTGAMNLNSLVTKSNIIN